MEQSRDSIGRHLSVPEMHQILDDLKDDNLTPKNELAPELTPLHWHLEECEDCRKWMAIERAISPLAEYDRKAVAKLVELVQKVKTAGAGGGFVQYARPAIQAPDDAPERASQGIFKRLIR